MMARTARRTVKFYTSANLSYINPRRRIHLQPKALAKRSMGLLILWRPQTVTTPGAKVDVDRTMFIGYTANQLRHCDRVWKFPVCEQDTKPVLVKRLL
jgi:hypothetical protein